MLLLQCLFMILSYIYIPWYEYAHEIHGHGMNMHIVNEFYTTSNVFDLYGFSDTIYADGTCIGYIY